MKSVPPHTKQRVEKLRKEIEHHRYLYHVLDRQEISDAALDSLKHDLSQLESQYPQLITPDSPTQRVGGKPLPELKKVRHEQLMLSFDDAFSYEEVQAWEKRWRKLAPSTITDYVIDLKLDGLAISLVFIKGVLSAGVTRGDGTVGEDVTHNVRMIESVPLRIRSDELSPQQRKVAHTGRIEIRGEVVMLKADFEALNRRQKAAGLPEFANPRNVSAGSIRQLDPKLAAARKLDFYAWELVTNLGQKTLEEGYRIIKKLGIKVNPRAVVCRDLKAVQAAHEHISREREKIPFWIDGIVVKVNNRELYERLGVVGKAPRAALAYKFAAQQATTVVEDIRVQVGRTGALTPVAHLKPVQVAGTTVSRATLHNADEIERLDVRTGDTVIIHKAGDIIPEVVQVLKNLRPRSAKTFHMPTRCPVCREAVERRRGEVIHYCVNPLCPARQREGLYHFASKRALDIDGLGPSTIDALVDDGLVRTPADFFSVNVTKLQELPLFAEKRAENLVKSLRSARSPSLDRFIFSLGIRHVGEQTAVDLAHHFRSLSRIVAAREEEIASVPNVGTVVAASIAGFFRDPKNRKLLAELRKVLHVMPPPAFSSTTLKAKTVVVTGTLQSLSREQAHERIRAAGGIVSTSVGASTSYLVVGENPGSKLEQAKKHSVEVIDEKKFLTMVG